MNRFNAASAALFVAALTAGCAPKTDDASKPDVPPHIVSLSVTPASTLIAPGSSVALAAIAQLSNGSVVAVAAEWSLGATGIVTLSSSFSTTVVADGVALGTVQVTALVSGMTASALIEVSEWLPPGLNTPVYGLKSGDKGMVKYDLAGAVSTFPSPVDAGMGMAVNRDASRVHVSGRKTGIANLVICTVDPASPAAVLMQGEIPDSAGYFGLDVDADGSVISQGFGEGKVFRYDPVSGAVAAAGVLKIKMQLSLAIAPDGRFYTAPMLTGPGGTMILRQDPAAVTSQLWATVPYDIETHVGYVTAVGVTFDDDGIGYAINYEGHVVLRMADVNGDGLALLEEEVTRYATIPAVIAELKGGIVGLTNAGGRGGLLVNAMRVDSVADATLGIYFVHDINHDGDADDEGEITLFSPVAIPNDQDTGCVAAGR